MGLGDVTGPKKYLQPHESGNGVPPIPLLHAPRKVLGAYGHAVHFPRALGYGMRYTRAHWNVRVVAYMYYIRLLHKYSEYLQLATMQIAVDLQCQEWTLSLGKHKLTSKRDIVFLDWR